MFDDFTCSGSTDATVHGISNNVIRIPENDVPHLQQAVVLVRKQMIFIICSKRFSPKKWL